MLIFGTIGIFRRFLPLPSGFLAACRGFIGVAFLLPFMLKKDNRPSKAQIKDNLAVIVISGALIGFNWILLFEAYNYTSVALATLCYYMAPVFVMLAAPFFLGEKLTLKKGGCIALALVGMVLVSGASKADFGASALGIALGLGAAVLYAAVIILNKKLGDIPAHSKTIMQLFAAAVVVLPYSLIRDNISAISFTPHIIALLLVVGAVNTAAAYALYFGSMDGLKAQTIALFGYIDPITAIILSSVILHEKMSAAELAGGILILFATMLSEIKIKSK